MIKDEVFIVGFTVAQALGGTYDLVAWHRLKGGGRMHQADYTQLSWAECVDVMLAELHGRRPGMRLGETWYQPAIELEG